MWEFIIIGFFVGINRKISNAKNRSPWLFMLLPIVLCVLSFFLGIAIYFWLFKNIQWGANKINLARTFGVVFCLLGGVISMVITLNSKMGVREKPIVTESFRYEVLPKSKILDAPVFIQITRKKSFVGSDAVSDLYLNNMKIGILRNGESRTISTTYSHNSIMFKNNDGSNTLYFKILPNQSPHIVLTFSKFKKSDCKNCVFLTKEEAYSTL